MATQRDENDEFEGEYIGNMWGWKFSYFSLGLIIVLMALIGFRYWQTGEFPMPEKYEKMKKDSVELIENRE